MHPPAVPAAVLTLLLAAGAASQESSPDPIRAQLEALLAEHEQSELGAPAAYPVFRPRFEAFVETHRGTEPEVRATLWLVQNTWWLRSQKTAEKTMEKTSMPLAEDLLARHPKSPQLGLLVEYRYVFTKEQQRTLYERMLEVSPLPEVKAAAHFGLAKLDPKRLDDGSPSPHFAALLDEFADVRWRQTTFGRIADAHLNPLSADDLAIGRQAPEIEGLDQDGAPMKLSDFRGKVVLLDFWGDW